MHTYIQCRQVSHACMHACMHLETTQVPHEVLLFGGGLHRLRPACDQLCACVKKWVAVGACVCVCVRVSFVCTPSQCPDD